MNSAQPGKSLPENPLLKRLFDGGAGSAISFQGYVGPAGTEGAIGLYRSLDDLSESIEIAQGDILDFAELPESVLPLGGVIVWIKRDATITYRSSRAVKSVDASAAKSDLVEAGRLRMRVRQRPDRAMGVCQSRCGVCQSKCGVCQSR